MQCGTLLLAVCVLLLWLAPPAHAQVLSQPECQQLQDRIEKYTSLRRSGGSARQMESWKRSRKYYEDRFRKGDCYKFGVRLK